MYRLECPTLGTLNKFYSDYQQKIVDGINFFLGGREVDVTFNDRAKTTVKVGVDVGSPTDRFLKHILQPRNLHALMTINPQDFLKVIKYVYGLFPQIPSGLEILANSRLSWGIYQKYYPGNPKRIDHFNTIVHHIFVDRVFDGVDANGNAIFNKKQFCKKAQVVICPYCGAEDITTSKIPVANGASVVKPDVDHFLPKSKYPYLAMSFGNLIPTSVPCNRGRKRAMDPIVDITMPRFWLQNPYLYDDSKMEFYYDFNNTNRSYASAYKVKVRGEKALKAGYRMMGYDNLYNGKAFMVGELYDQMAGLSQQYYDMLQTYGIPQDQWGKMKQPDLQLVLGYDTNEVSARIHPYYKFRYDMAIQLIRDSGCNWPWLK